MEIFERIFKTKFLNGFENEDLLRIFKTEPFKQFGKEIFVKSLNQNLFNGFENGDLVQISYLLNGFENGDLF